MLAKARRSLVRMDVQVTLLHSFIFVSTVQVRIVSFLHCSAVRQERGSLGGAFARFVRLWNFYACLQREGNVRLLALVSDMSSPLLARLGRMGQPLALKHCLGLGQADLLNGCCDIIAYFSVDYVI